MRLLVEAKAQVNRQEEVELLLDLLPEHNNISTQHHMHCYESPMVVVSDPHIISAGQEMHVWYGPTSPWLPMYGDIMYHTLTLYNYACTHV